MDDDERGGGFGWGLVVGLALGVVTHLLLRNLLSGRFGRAFLSLQADEIAAESVGVSVYPIPPSQELAGCVERLVRGLRWPSSAKMDSFVTTY